MNRRQSRLPIVAVLGAVVALLFTIACGADATSTPVPTTAPPAPVATTAPVAPTVAPPPAAMVPEGTLTVAFNAIDPGAAGVPFHNTNPGNAVAAIAFDSMLYREKEGGGVIGSMAESWELVPEEGRLTFFIRKGMPWHGNGEWGDVTSADVKWTIENVRQDGTIHISGFDFRDITRIETPDPYRIDLFMPADRLVWTTSLFNRSLSLSLSIVSKKYIEAVGEDKAILEWIGTNSWEHEDTRTGDQVSFSAVEDHWRTVPEFKTLIVRAIPEPSVQIAAIRAGEVDIMSVPPSLLNEAKLANIRLISGAGGSWSWLMFGGLNLPERASPDVEGIFNPNNLPDGTPWVGDPADPASMEKAKKVRLALNLAIDRQEMHETIWGSLWPVMVIPPGFFPGTDWLDPSWKPYALDVARAQQLMTEAGYGDGFKLEILMDPGVFTDTYEAIARYWETNLGMDVVRTTMGWGDIRAKYRVPRTFSEKTPQLARMGSSFREEPWGTLANTITTTDGMGLAEDLRIDDWFGRSSLEFDLAERKKLALEWGNFFVEEHLYLPLAIRADIFGLGPNIGDWVNRLGYAWNNLEDVPKA